MPKRSKDKRFACLRYWSNVLVKPKMNKGKGHIFAWMRRQKSCILPGAIIDYR